MGAVKELRLVGAQLGRPSCLETMSGEKPKNTEPQALREVLEGLNVASNPEAQATADEKHAFWDTQPVPRISKRLHLACIADVLSSCGHLLSPPSPWMPSLAVACALSFRLTWQVRRLPLCRWRSTAPSTLPTLTLSRKSRTDSLPPSSGPTSTWCIDAGGVDRRSCRLWGPGQCVL